jgi:acyl-CoA synthetase (AMP-forming)/AMP-acid ligase II
VVRDLVAGVEKTYQHLISDVLAFRNVLERSLSHEARSDLIADKEVYIGLLAPGGYEYTVGFIAILAIGAAVVPMGKFRYYKKKDTQLISSSCYITSGRSLILFIEGAMCGFGSQHNQRKDCTVCCSLYGRK